MRSQLRSIQTTAVIQIQKTSKANVRGNTECTPLGSTPVLHQREEKYLQVSCPRAPTQVPYAHPQPKVQRKTECCAGMSRLSGKVENKRLITGFPGRIRFVRLPCRIGTVQVLYRCRILQSYAVQEEGGTPEVVNAVLRIINWSIRIDVVVVVVVVAAVSSSRWGLPSQ